MNARLGIGLFLGVPAVALVVATLLATRMGDRSAPPAPDERVVAVVSSPDGTRGATVVEVSGVAGRVDARLVRVGGREAFACSGGGPLRVRWTDARTLEIAFANGRTMREGTIPGLKVVVEEKVAPP